jgi:hypothetical protein
MAASAPALPASEGDIEMRPLQIPILVLASLLFPAAGAQPLQVAPFRSVELRNGGEIVIRQGPEQQVTLVQGDRGNARLQVVDGRLIVDKCRTGCRHGARPRLVITMPAVDGLAVAHGGVIRTDGRFTRQASLAAAVEQGGTLDIRAMTASNVAAAVDNGGRIFTRPLESLTASVRSGGNVTYWGSPAVRRAIAGGGVIEQGDPADAERPLAELAPPHPILPVLPRLPDHPRRH